MDYGIHPHQWKREAAINSRIKYDEDDEVVNVCQTIQEMRKELESKGRLM